MKKLFLFTVLVLAFAATAYSQDLKLDFRASGFFDMTTELWQWNNFYGQETPASNLPLQFPFGPGAGGGIINVVGATDRPPQYSSAGAQTAGGQWNKTSSYVQSRGRLKFDAIMGKELSGTIFFEMDSETWGDASNGTTQQRNRIGYFQGDRAGVEIKNLYFDVAIPLIPVPMTARFGLQPFGIRSNVFMYSDGTGVTVAAKADPVEIVGYWVKALEGRIATNDDVNAWGLQVKAKVDTFTLGGYGWYWKHNTYPLNTFNYQTLINDPSAGYGVINNPIRGPMWWFSGYADGRLGPVNINFDFIYDFGNIENKVVAGVPKVDYNGWATRLKVDYPWEAFNFGFVGVYGSGGDANKMGFNGIPGESVANPAYAATGRKASKVGSYVVPVQSETGADDSEVLLANYVSGAFNGWGYSQANNQMTRGSYGGLWFVKLYGAYKPSPDYKITLQGLYFGDTTSHGDTFGYAFNAAGGLHDGKAIGWEFDVINEWQVYRNLVFRFGGGFLIPGSALEFSKFVPGVSIPVGSEKPNTPWILTTRLIYSF